MEKLTLGQWQVFTADMMASLGTSETLGKWMSRFTFENQELAEQMCERAVSEGICSEAKYTILDKAGQAGVMCFFAPCNSDSQIKTVLNWMIENDLVRRTKAGNLFNIRFVLGTITINCLNDFLKDGRIQ